MDFLDAFDRTVRVHGAETALVTDDGRTVTYRAFDRRSTRLTNALAERVGETPLAVLAGNTLAAMDAMVAGHKRGVPTVQLPYREAPAGLVEMAETADAGALLFDDANRETALTVLNRGDFDLAIHARSTDRTADETLTAEAGVSADDIVPYEQLQADASATLPADSPGEGKTNIFYTSGTTSQPKAVAFDSHQMWLGAYQGALEHGIDHTDVAIVATPWYHMFTADAWLYPHWLAGATTVLQPSFDPVAVFELIEEHDATGLAAVPTQLDSLVDVQTDQHFDTSSLSYIRTAGAVVPEDLIERTTDHLAEGLYNTYGLTEGGPNLTFALPEAQADHPGTVGKESFAWEVRVVEAVGVDDRPDPTATVDAGERGEVIARGPGVPDGYVDNPEAEARTFFDGWLRTRDVARVDDDGYLYVVDRVDNMFVSGGENVYPREVETVLEAHDGVSEALVFGRDDDHWGQRVTAVVVTDGSVTADDLEAFCLAHDTLADFKRPREYALRSDPLPRTDTGTVKREAVISEHFG